MRYKVCGPFRNVSLEYAYSTYSNVGTNNWCTPRPPLNSCMSEYTTLSAVKSTTCGKLNE